VDTEYIYVCVRQCSSASIRLETVGLEIHFVLLVLLLFCPRQTFGVFFAMADDSRGDCTTQDLRTAETNTPVDAATKTLISKYPTDFREYLDLTALAAGPPSTDDSSANASCRPPLLVSEPSLVGVGHVLTLVVDPQKMEDVESYSVSFDIARKSVATAEQSGTVSVHLTVKNSPGSSHGDDNTLSVHDIPRKDAGWDALETSSTLDAFIARYGVNVLPRNDPSTEFLLVYLMATVLGTNFCQGNLCNSGTFSLPKTVVEDAMLELTERSFLAW